MTDEERAKRRHIAAEAAFEKIWSDVCYQPPEAVALTREQIRKRLDRMAYWLMPDGSKFDKLSSRDLSLLPEDDRDDE